MLRTAAFLLFLTLAISTAAEKPKSPAPVELLAEQPLLQPASTLELRFAQEMISAEEVGLVAEPSPLVLEPAVPGKFTWLSRRSGVFVPAGPWPLGMKARLSLRAGLMTAAGQPAPAWEGAVATPPFGVEGVEGGEVDDPITSALPRLVVVFNRPVDLKTAEGKMAYVDEGGQRQPAEIRLARRGESWDSDKPNYDDWETRWKLAQDGLAGSSEDEEAQHKRHRGPQPHQLVLRPKEPLTAGLWHLEVQAGMRSADGRNTLEQTVLFPLGRLENFQVKEVKPMGESWSSGEVGVRFSQEVEPDLTPELCARLFTLEPPVPDARFRPYSTTVYISGSFKAGQTYRLRISPELRSREGYLVTGKLEHPVLRTPKGAVLKPMHFTEIEVQAAGGKVEFESLNLQSLNIRAVLVSPKAALAAWTKVGSNSDFRRQPGEENTLLSFPGKKTYETKVPLNGALDSPQKTARTWDELFQGQRFGTLLLTVEGTPREGAGETPEPQQALVQRSDLGVEWRKLGDELEVKVTSRADGAAVPGAAATLLTGEGKALQHGVAGPDGRVRLPLGPEPAWLSVEKGPDRHLVRMGTDAEYLPELPRGDPEANDWTGHSAKAPPGTSAYLISDRPLYRPGETIHVKGFVRTRKASGWKIGAGVELTLELSDPDDEVIATQRVRTDAQGSLTADFTVAATATRGSYALRLKAGGGGENFSMPPHRVKVEDFQPDAFELTMAVPKRTAAAEAIKATLESHYYYGAPVEGGTVRWTLQHVEEKFAPEEFKDWDFDQPTLGRLGKALPEDLAGEEDEGEAPEVQLLHGETALVKGGAPLLVQPDLPAAANWPVRYVLTAEVTDLNGQTVTTAAEGTRDATDFYLGLRLLGPYAPGTPLPILAVAVRPDGKPWPAAVPIHVEIRSTETVYDREPVARTARVAFHARKVVTTHAKAEGATLVPKREGEEWVFDKDSSATLPALPEGTYECRLSARDPAGRETVMVDQLVVSARTAKAREMEPPGTAQSVNLRVDPQEYQPGQTAHLEAKPAFTGTVTAWVEQGTRILRSFPVKLTEGATSFDLPLKAEDAPGVEVVLLATHSRAELAADPSQFTSLSGAISLRVRPAAQMLKAQVIPAKAEWEPGQEVSAEVRIADGAGAPVAGAEVAFYAVDEGVLALAEEQKPDPEWLLRQEAYSLVRTGLSLFRCWPMPTDDSMAKAMIGNMVEGLDSPAAKPRQDFSATACWLPKLMTDAEGKVTARFRAPDALTRYRLTAVASEGAARFAVATASVAIRQPLIVLPGVGQFGHVGDEWKARATVRNESGVGGTCEAVLKLDATAEAAAGAPEGLRVTFPLGAAETHVVELPVRLRAEGEARWIWEVRLKTGERSYEDAVESALRVISPALRLRETYLGEAHGAGADLLAEVNPQLLEGAGTATVRLSNSRLAGLREADDYLLHYPYGCAEQTISSMMPWVLQPQLQPYLPELGDEEHRREMLRSGLQKLFGMQQPNGGLGLWPESRDASLFLSAYGALLCALLPEGVAPPAGTREKLLAYVKSELEKPPVAFALRAPGDEALACWAMALAGEPAGERAKELAGHSAQLSREERALLALALLEGGAPGRSVRRLLDPAVPAPEGFSWFGGEGRERALQLLAWVRLDAHDPEVARQVKEVLKARHHGHWSTTQGDAWALLALARYAAVVEAKQPRELAGTLAGPAGEDAFVLTAGHPIFMKTVPYEKGGLGKWTAHATPATATLYTELELEAQPVVERQPAQNRGYAISRRYALLAADGTARPANELHPGDRVLVTLRVETAKPGHFVAIDDPLPSVLEAINPAFRSRQTAQPPAPWETELVDHQELREGRVLLFRDHLPAGVHEFSYLARVRGNGKVFAPAAKIEEMYRPERFGLSEAGGLEVR